MAYECGTVVVGVQQLMEDRDGAGAASRWQYAEPRWSTSAPGELE